MLLRSVLVPVDFSPASRIAVNYGIALARRFRGRLTLLNVVEPAPAPMTEQRQYAQAARLLPSLVAPEDQDDLDITILVRSGGVEEQILSAIQDEQSDIVVMGTHGRGLLGRLFIGSATQHILRKVTAPIITVGRVSGPLEVHRILFAADFSDGSAQAFDWTLEFAKVTKSELVILHAVQNLHFNYEGAEFDSDWAERARSQAETVLNKIAARAAAAGVAAETVIDDAAPADSILKAAGSVDLIALPVARKGLLERLTLGTTAERVIREAHTPVLCIPAPAGPEPIVIRSMESCGQPA